MAQQYIVQLRRGWKEDDRDDWARYEEDPNHIKPLAGELVLEYDHGVPRLKIGDGIHEFSELPYISVDSFVLPKPISITLDPDKWEQVTDEDDELVVDTFSQVVTVENTTITTCCRIDLQPTLEQLAEFYQLGIALTTENNNAEVRVYSVGTKPIKEYTIPATVTEIIADQEVIIDDIYGIPVGGGGSGASMDGVVSPEPNTIVKRDSVGSLLAINGDIGSGNPEDIDGYVAANEVVTSKLLQQYAIPKPAGDIDVNGRILGYDSNGHVTTYDIDTTPTIESTNLISSDGVASEFTRFSVAYDKIIEDAKNECKNYTDDKVQIRTASIVDGVLMLL